MFNKNMWIEKYTLRYGVGTITGALIIYFQFGKEQGLQDLTWQKFPVLLLSGFAFSFIASAPLFVFHVCRGIKKVTAWKILFIIFSLIIILLNIILFIMNLCNIFVNCIICELATVMILLFFGMNIILYIIFTLPN